MKRTFDLRFGPEWIASVPTDAGIYRVYDENERLIYVGKAKNLRRRLSQYRNSKRRKAHRKMRLIVKDASRIETQICASEAEALLAENECIRNHRPRLNEAGAFSEYYPYLGVKTTGRVTQIYLTQKADGFELNELFGVYRSKANTIECLESLAELLGLVAIKVPGRAPEARKVVGSMQKAHRLAHLFAFRDIHPHWASGLISWLKGEPSEALAQLLLQVADQPLTTNQRPRVQKAFDALRRFERTEIRPLKKALARAQRSIYPVLQRERDALFICSKYKTVDTESLNKYFDPSRSTRDSRL